MNLERIRELIDEKGIKHKWLAVRIGVTPGTLSRFLTGKTAIHKSALILLSQELGASLNELKVEAS